MPAVASPVAARSADSLVVPRGADGPAEQAAAVREASAAGACKRLIAIFDAGRTPAVCQRLPAQFLDNRVMQ